jgi:hypothetical protein
MNNNGKDATVTTEVTQEVEQMIVTTDPATGRVSVQGFPNNFRAAKQRLDGAMLALAEFFLHAASRGQVDANGTYTGGNVDESADTQEVVKHYMDLVARGGWKQALEEIEQREDKADLAILVSGIYADAFRTDDQEQRAYAAAFLSSMSPDSVKRAEYWADRIAKRREELGA